MPYLSTAGSARACGVGDCTCLVPTLDGLGDTSGPRMDRIPPTRPPWRHRLYRELKKLIFSAPRKCPIGRFGPQTNGRILKRLHAREFALPSALQAASWRLVLDWRAEKSAAARIGAQVILLRELFVVQLKFTDGFCLAFGWCCLSAGGCRQRHNAIAATSTQCAAPQHCCVARARTSGRPRAAPRARTATGCASGRRSSSSTTMIVSSRGRTR